MEHKENKSDSNVTSVYKILLCDENSKDVANKPEKTNKTDQFPAQVAGPGSSGGKRVKTKFTPPDATGYVRSSSGKLQLIPKLSQKKILLRASVTDLTKERDSLLEISMLNSKLESLENPGSHPVPDPSKDYSKSEGSEGAIYIKKPVLRR